VGVRATKIWFNELMFSVKEPALKRSYGSTKSSQNQSLPWDKDEMAFKAIEKYRYDLRKTVWKHLNLKTAGKNY